MMSSSTYVKSLARTEVHSMKDFITKAVAAAGVVGLVSMSVKEMLPKASKGNV